VMIANNISTFLGKYMADASKRPEKMPIRNVVPDLANLDDATEGRVAMG